MQPLNQEQITYFARFIHPAKSYAYMPGVSDGILGPMMGCDPALYEEVCGQMERNAAEGARALLAEPEFAARVNRLPFGDGETVVGLADSITDDLQSWFEILRHVLKQARPGRMPTLLNHGISGDTTASLLARFYGITQLDPDWMICMVGTNDAREHGEAPAKPMVSLAETEANLRALRAFAARQTKARWVWMTPTPVVESAIPGDWWLGPQQMMWRNENLRAIADVVRALPEPVVDLWAAFGEPAPAGWLSPDGLHPSLEGQKAILRALVQRLVDSQAAVNGNKQPRREARS